MSLFKNLLGILMVAEGALTLLFPKKYVQFWRSDKMPKQWNKKINQIAKHEDELRLVAGIETLVGLFIVLYGSCCKHKKDSCCNRDER